QREGEIGPHHVEAAMGEIDDPHDAEDEREPARHQEQQQPILHAVQHLDEEEDHAVGHWAISQPLCRWIAWAPCVLRLRASRALRMRGKRGWHSCTVNASLTVPVYLLPHPEPRRSRESKDAPP